MGAPGADPAVGSRVGASNRKRGVGFPLEVLVELGRGSREGGGRLVVCCVLGHGRAFYAAVEEADEDAAPEEDGEAKGGQDGADGDKYGAIWEGRVVHEGSIVGGRDGGRGVSRDAEVGTGGEGREIGEGQVGGRLREGRECFFGLGAGRQRRRSVGGRRCLARLRIRGGGRWPVVCGRWLCVLCLRCLCFVFVVVVVLLGVDSGSEEGRQQKRAPQRQW